MNITLKTILLSFLCSMIFMSVQAQNFIEIENIINNYEEEDAIILAKHEDVVISIKKGELLIHSKHHKDKVIIGDKAQGYADESIYYNETFNETTDIKAFALIPKGNRYKKVKALGISTKAKLQSSIFYHDDKVKEIVFPKMDPGSRAVISYNEEIKDPHFLGSFFFSSFMPIVEARYSVSFPSSVKVKFTELNLNDRIIFEENVKNGITTYTWTANNIDHYEYSADAPSLRYYEPHVIIYIDQYEIDGKVTKVLSDVGELYKWYYSLVSNVNQKSDEVLSIIVDSLIDGIESPETKAKLIYYWVQDNIRYVAFEDGYSGFIPRSAGTVCSRKFGDCKDMTSIIVEMLGMADIDANICWLGSRDIPYSYHDVPTPMVDNHMIAFMEINDRNIFLDATGQYTPFGMPTSFIQGKEALVGKGSDSYELVNVPVIQKEQNDMVDSVYVTISDEQVNGSGLAQYRGYKKLDKVYRLIDKTNEKVKESLKGMLEKGHNKFSIEKAELSGIDDRDKQLDIKYEFTIPDYVKNIDNRIYINLNLDKKYYNQYIDIERRKLDKEIDYKHSEKYITVLEIPDGFKLKYIPANAKYKSDDFGFELNYMIENNKIYLEKDIYIDTLLIRKDRFEDWNKMITGLSGAYNEVIVLER